ncbi:MAG: TIGR04372 family glycosyltransferase [Elusimicrobia bacterium]|nr:TIGR04372 family glycosyltransferase [Elusimicrobiota bacterium]
MTSNLVFPGPDTWARHFANKISDFLDRNSPILITTPEVGHLGDAAEPIYFGLLKARRDNKKLLVLYSPALFWKFRIKIVNPEIYDLESDYCYSPTDLTGRLLRWFWVALFGSLKIVYLMWRKCLRLLQLARPSYVLGSFDWYTAPDIGRSTLWKPAGVSYFSWDCATVDRWEKEFNEYLPVRLSREKLRRGEKLRLKAGIPSSDWFACLHVRSSGYYNDRSDLQAAPRNGHIENYVQAIRAITKAGGRVVRLGDSSMAPLPAMERVVDLTQSPFNNGLFNVYLMSQCRFFFGTNSGPELTCTKLFQKPSVTTDLPGLVMFPSMKKGDLAIFKHVYSRSRGRFLSLKERLEAPGQYERGAFYCTMADDYILQDNTPEEIYDVIEEFLARAPGAPYSDLQKIFNEARKDQIRRFLNEELVEKAPVLISQSVFVEEQYHLATYCAHGGTLGQKYLEQNWQANVLNVAKYVPTVVTAARSLHS